MGRTGRVWGIAAGLLAPLALMIAEGAALPAGPPVTPGSGISLSSSSSPSRSVFERRIRPLLLAKNPSSCSECHLSGVDLKEYIRPSEAETFAALRQQGLVDLKRPEQSRILRFIQMKRPKTPLVNQNIRSAEYGAFRDWITAAAGNPKLASMPKKKAGRVGPAVPDDVIRHTRVDAVVDSFERNVWSQQGRCMNCHLPDNKKNIEKYGQRVAWFVPDDPEATMRRLIAQGAVNIDKPGESLLLLKPLNKVAHGGGVKMLYGDAGYKLFRAWLEDYSRSVKGGYRTAAELPTRPADALVHLDTILNVSGGPLSWADKLLRVDVYGWDEEHRAWGTKPVATGERGMFAGKDSAGKDSASTSTNLIMFLIVPAAERESAAARLRARLKSGGRYQLRYYCDTGGGLMGDYTLPTDSAAFHQGQQEVTVASWSGGWGKPVKVTVDPAALTSAAPAAKR